MPQSLTALYVHIVFSTKDRTPLLHDPDIRSNLHAYIGGIAKKLNCHPLGVGGTSDHVHVLIRMQRTIAVADLVRGLKSNSSSWARERIPRFSWQAGYGAFSFGANALSSEQHYVANQESHHAKVSFQDELRNLLAENGMEWDEEFLWD